MADAWLLAVVPALVIGIVLAILGRLLTAPDRRRAEAEAERERYDAARDGRIAMLTVERDEARADEARCRQQVAELEAILSRYRPVRKTAR